jgi:CubicO group peptidase (beta-lactamase class C family)
VKDYFRQVAQQLKAGKGVDMSRAWAGAVLVLTVFLSGRVAATDVPRAHPEDVGFSAERLRYIDQFFADKVERGDLAGIVTLVARHGKVVHFSAVGYADREKKERMRTDTIFRVYSQTKAITSAALMILYEEGRFQLTDPVSKFIPTFGQLNVLRTPQSSIEDTVPLQRPPTIQDLMRHTAGFSHGIENNVVDAAYINADVFGIDVSLEQMMNKLSTIPLIAQPGKRVIYSVGPDVQARLVEILSGVPFDEFLKTRLFKPLGMKDTGFWVPPDRTGRLATVYWAKDGKLTPLDQTHGYPVTVGFLAKPEVVNSYTVDHQRKGGSYGLVSTAEDYWRFAQMMLNGGALDGTRILSPQVVRYMTRDHTGNEVSMPGWFPKGTAYGLGFGVVKDAAAMGVVGSDGAFFWGGAALTQYWIDPKANMVILAMTQHLGAPRAAEVVAELQPLVYSALME